jgi:phage terminase large subunit GpA-like protein
MNSPLETCAQDFFEAFRPPEKLTLSQWADRNAYLSAESSAEPGRWRTIPYQRGMMDAMTDPTIEIVTVMKSARVGYTKMLNNLIGYHIHQDPCPMMLVQPTDIDAEGYSKEEVSPMIRDTPVLQALVSDAKAKDSSNTILQKMFPGGTLALVGANSPRGFRRVSRRVVMFDEIDGYPASAGTEGDPIKLGMRRAEYYWNRKFIAGTTPLDKETSRIDKLFEASDQRRYYVPCPSCGHMDHLVFREPKSSEELELGGHWMAWPDGEPDRAHFVCSKNRCLIEHSKKRWMVENGEWRARNPSAGTRNAGFHIWAAYSYSPNATWAHLAREFLESKDDPTMLKTFVNTVLGQLWEEEYTAKLGADSIRSRAETYDANVVPMRALVLTAGLDVQDNRIAVSVYAWGRGEESWIQKHVEIYGDPAQAEIWKQVDDVLFQKWKHESGAEMKIIASCIDSGGHFTHEVYAYARERKKQRVLAIKGQSQRGKQAIGKPTRQDINFKGQTLKKGVQLYPVGSDTIKTTLYARLKKTIPGPGYLHFHAGLPPEFFKQLTSEKKLVRHLRGHAVTDWVKKDGARNEALDCAVYAYAAMQWLYTQMHRATIWEQLEKKLGLQEAAEPAPEPAPAPADDATGQAKPAPEPDAVLQKLRTPRTILKRPRGGFVSRY